MTTITVVLRDNYEGFTEPLIYVVDVENPQDEAEVLAACRVQRSNDLGEEPGDGVNDLDLTIMFAFPGCIPTVADWRTGGGMVMLPLWLALAAAIWVLVSLLILSRFKDSP